MKVVYDTCLYIDLLRGFERLALFTDRTHIRYMSPVVIMELLAGAKTPRQKKVVDKLIHPYSKASRLISISSGLFYKAGCCLEKLQASQLSKGFTHDLLIALSAASVGAVLFTSNKKDFARIARQVPVKMEYV